MATPIIFEQANTVFIGDPQAGISDLYAWNEGPHNVSVWRLSPMELEEIQRTGLIALDVLCGRNAPPPVFVGSITQTKELIYGPIQGEAIHTEDVAEVSASGTPQASGIPEAEVSTSASEVRHADAQLDRSPSAQDLPEEILQGPGSV
jgi:hypothetical protein